MKTLQDVVTAIVQELSASQAPFSAYDVTAEARKHVNNSTDQFDLIRGDVEVNQSQVHSWLIDHEDVKAIIRGMFDRDELTRQFTGNYYQYQSSIAAQPLNLTPLKTVMTNRMGFIVLIHSIIAENMNVCNLDDMVADIDANISLPNFLSKYELDSLDVVEFVMSLEEHLDIDIDDEDFNGQKSIEDVVLMLAVKFKADATADLSERLYDIIEPLQQIIYPNAAPIVAPVQMSGGAHRIALWAITDYLKRSAKRGTPARSIKNIQSTFRSGLKSKDIFAAVSNSNMFKINRTGTRWTETFVSVA